MADMHMVSFSFESQDEKWKQEIEQLGVKVTLVPAKETTLFQMAKNMLFGEYPHSIIKYNSPRMKVALEKLVKEQHFDAVHFDHLHLAHYVECFKGTPCFLDAHNVEYKLLERCFQVEPWGIKKMLYRQQALKMRSFEAMKINEFKSVFACSLEDKEILSSLVSGQTPVNVIANGVDTGYCTPALNQDQDGEASLIFTGAMDWLPNDDAITYFCNKILPLIWHKKELVKLYVVGKKPSTVVKDLAVRDPRVIVTGRVEDVRPYIRRAKVSIVPLRIGGGTRLKILEAMSMSKAIVSTSIGAEGIAYTEGKNILVADTPQDFADKVLFLLDNVQKTQEIGTEARKFVLEQYDWDIIGHNLRKIYKEAVNVH